MSRGIPLKWAWYGLVVLLVLAPMLILYPWLWEKARSLMLDRALAEEQRFNQDVKHHVDHEYKRIVTLLENKGDSIAFLSSGSPDSDLIHRHLEAVLAREEAVRGLAVVDPEGQILEGIYRGPAGQPLRMDTHLGGSPLDPNQPEIAIPLHGRVFVGSPIDHRGELVFRVAIPVGPPAQPIASFLAHISAEWLWRELYDEFARPDAITYLVDNRGCLLAYPEGYDQPLGELLTHLDIVRSTIEHEEWNSRTTYLGLKGVSCFGSATPIDSMNWGVITEIPVRRITEPINAVLGGMAATTLGFGALLGVLGLWIVRRTTRPFTELTAAFGRARGGDYSEALPLSRVREFNTLSDGFRAMISNIQSREESLQESEERFSKAFMSSPQAVIISRLDDGCIVDVNVSFERMASHSRAKMIGRTTDELGLWERPSDREDMVRAIREHGSVRDMEAAFRSKSGERRIGRVSAERIDIGGVPHLLSIAEDITERKRAEEAVVRFSRVLEKSLNEIYIFDGETLHFVNVNYGARDNLGYTMEELRDLTPLDLKPEFTPESFAELIEPLRARDQEKVEFTTVHRRKDGTEYPVEVHLQLVTVGTPVFVAIIMDITDRKQAEVERARLAAAIEQAAEGVIITDTEGTIQYVNPAFERTTGYTCAEVLGRNPRILKSGKMSQAFYEEFWSTIKAGRVWTGHVINKKKDGTLFEEEATVSPIFDETGTIINFVGVKRDVTREIELESQLRQSQKMDAIGQLASRVAHEFNNLLVGILGNAELLLAETGVETPEGFKQPLEDIAQSGRRAAELTSQLLMFSRRKNAQVTRIELNPVVSEMRRMLRQLVGEHIKIKTSLAADLEPIGVEAGEIEQVIMNLALNARDAMPKGGTLSLRTEKVSLNADQASRILDARPGPYTILSISDTGCGISDEIAEHIFEPFFTTKPAGKGTGLGLATVFSIVHKLGGHIVVDRRPGAGTVFRVYLPEAGETDELSPASEPHPQRGVGDRDAGGETILVCDDDAIVRRTVSELLRAVGYTVLVAGSGREALAMAESEGESISLLLTDYRMPEMNGFELARQLTKKRRDMKVLFMSGYESDLLEESRGAGVRVEVLRKPIARLELHQRVREMLAGVEQADAL